MYSSDIDKGKEYWLEELNKLRQRKQLIIENIAKEFFGELTDENEGLCEQQYIRIKIDFKNWIEVNFPEKGGSNDI